MSAKFTKGPYRRDGRHIHMAQWSATVHPYCKAIDTAELEAVAALFRAAPLLHEALEAVEWAGMHEDGYSMCPRCKALEGDDAGHEPWCLIGNALRAARGEE